MGLGGVVLLGLRIALVAGFAYPSPRARWSLPESSLSQEGLSRSIRYAVHPDLCKQLKPLYINTRQAEAWGASSLVTCQEIDESLTRAFDAFSFNHKLINFFNVSQYCTAAEHAAGACAAAEIYIGVTAAQTDAEAALFARTQLAYSDEPPRDTANQLIYGDRTIEGATISYLVNDDTCFYLDDEFCIDLTNKDFDTHSFLLGVFFACVLIGGLMAIYRVTALFRTWFRLGIESAHKLLLMQLSHFWFTWIIGSLLIFPSGIYFGLYKPCFDCTSFEALTVHHVGLALGLGPLTEEAQTMGVMSRLGADGNYEKLIMDESVCQSAHLLPGESGSVLGYTDWTEGCSPPDDYWTCENRHFSVMLTPAPRHTQACLTEDDLDALNWLYPVCTGANAGPTGDNSGPICVRSERNHGLLKGAFYTGVPLFILAWFSFFALLGERKHQKNRMKKQKLMHHVLMLFGDKAQKIFDRTDLAMREEKKRASQHAMEALKVHHLLHLRHHGHKASHLGHQSSAISNSDRMTDKSETTRIPIRMGSIMKRVSLIGKVGGRQSSTTSMGAAPPSPRRTTLRTTFARRSSCQAALRQFGKKISSAHLYDESSNGNLDAASTSLSRKTNRPEPTLSAHAEAPEEV